MKLSLTLLFVFLLLNSHAQSTKSNVDEELVPQYELPEILVSEKGRKIKKPEQWEKIRRPEILHLFVQEVYGKVPGEIAPPEVIVYEDRGEAFGGKAIRKQIDLVFEGNGRTLSVGVLMYLPKAASPAPVILGYNFLGNHAIVDDPEIRISESWVRNNPSLGIVNNHFTEQSRGFDAESWPVEKMLDAGFGLVTVYYGEVDPDYDDFENGIHPLFYKEGQDHPAADEWASIGAWAWGLSRVMDYLETDSDVNAKQVIVFGHSRLGKTALWAVASDQRFAACISNDSGCMGAALSRRRFGETIGIANKNFPQWFCGNFKKYSGFEDYLPIDQHMLLALIAPRPLYVASATEDLWSDPKGEFLSAQAASAVYRLYGLTAIDDEQMPSPEHPVGGVLSYHLRTGKHAVKPFDWEQYLQWAKEYVVH
ncbi:glucuronyl esterase domain-containing protein [Mangrovibacterium diazotrophicum]|uniref:4-O-methyl-glucuronoyl methylesterase-like domain-containing protein n=1 Tax=Mangrovibacterium diazotrophicum TaxID=1261403 RepID=A0A419VU70_9BACT|nr:acetylxylan esterase [Mangrovibacterium diazotrophicum]RKD85025.1 hypothetical protein BC643_4544 [Mangrovibacterium diazotrophicum]